MSIFSLHLKKMAICAISASLLLSGCGGEGDDSSTSAEASSPYIKFDGSANGEGVIDANNTYVKFLKATRTMETFDKLPTDITLDDSNRIVKGGGTVIGAVKMVGGTNNSTIAGLVASNGTMLAVDSSAGGASLKNTNITFAQPNTSGSSGSGNGLKGTWCTDVSGDQNCWVFDNNTGSSSGKFYQQSINQYAGTLTNTMTWSVDMNNKMLTYRFTRSTLSGSSYNYDKVLNQSSYTFPFSLSGSKFTFQGNTFTRK